MPEIPGSRVIEQPSAAVALRGGAAADLRLATPQDGPELREYFSALSLRSRYNRFTGARGTLSDQELEAWCRIGENDRCAVVARLPGEGRIVGEAVYAFAPTAASVEFGLSVQDAFRGQGIGLALLSGIACRARWLGAHRMYGDILRSNDEMQALARKAGFAFAPTPGDWREVRVTKAVKGFCGDFDRAAGRRLVA